MKEISHLRFLFSDIFTVCKVNRTTKQNKQKHQDYYLHIYYFISHKQNCYLKIDNNSTASKERKSSITMMILCHLNKRPPSLTLLPSSGNTTGSFLQLYKANGMAKLWNYSFSSSPLVPCHGRLRLQFSLASTRDHPSKRQNC